MTVFEYPNLSSFETKVEYFGRVTLHYTVLLCSKSVVKCKTSKFTKS